MIGIGNLTSYPNIVLGRKGKGSKGAFSAPESVSRILSPEGFFPFAAAFQTRTRVQAVHSLFGHYCTYIFLRLELSTFPTQSVHAFARTDERTDGRLRDDEDENEDEDDNNHYDWQEGRVPGRRLETEGDFLRWRQRRLLSCALADIPSGIAFHFRPHR